MRRFTVLLLAYAGLAFSQISGAGQVGCTAAPVSGSPWTTATTVNTTQVLATNVSGGQVLVMLDQGTTLTVGAVQFQGDPGDGTFINLAAWQVVDPTTPPFATISQPYTLQASTNKQFLILMAGMYRLQLKLTTAITGTATVTPYTTIACYQLPILNFQATAANLNATVVGAGTAGSANASPVTVQGIASMTKLLVTPDSVALPANQSVNEAQVNGITTLTGAGATGTGSQRVTAAQDTTTIAGSAPGTAGTASANVVTVQGVASMTKLLVTPDSVALPANQSVNEAQVNGVAPLMNNGVSGTGSQRINVASDNTAVANWGQGATGSAVPSGATYIGGIGSGNLTGAIVCDNSSAINMSTATTTQIIAISGTGGRTYICSIDIVVGAADNVALVSGSGTNCASNLAGLAGGTTAATGWNFAANGGIAKGSGIGMIYKTVTTNNEICLVTSASAQVSGSITWTQF